LCEAYGYPLNLATAHSLAGNPAVGFTPVMTDRYHSAPD
jgi:hypothetical protein